MSDESVQPAAETVPGLSEWQRVSSTFTAPSKTFTDIKNGHRGWWMPFLIVLLTGAFLFGAITKQVTWKTVFDNQQRAMPEAAKRMMENMTPEQRAAQEARGPITQEITWGLSPLGLMMMNLLGALILWPTINFGFGGKAKFGAVFAVTMYSTLVLWPVKLLLGGIALFAGATPEAFNISNVAGTNIGYYMSEQSGPLFALATAIDPLALWNLALTGIGLAIVAGVKRSSGYIAVFTWWVLFILAAVGFSAAFS